MIETMMPSNQPQIVRESILLSSQFPALPRCLVAFNAHYEALMIPLTPRSRERSPPRLV